MIELVKPDFVFGQEKRFFDFIKDLGSEKIALISHNDPDGLISAKVVNTVLKADILKFIDYDYLNSDLIEDLKKAKARKVILTDLMIKDDGFIKNLEKFADILIIDHHTPERDYNSEKTVYLNAQGYCAGYLCYYLFSKLQDLEVLDWLVACASTSDWQYEKNKDWMKIIYEKYGDHYTGTIEGMAKGKMFDFVLLINRAIVYFRPKVEEVYERIGEKFGDIGDLKQYADEVNKEYEEKMEEFDKNKIETNGRYFWEYTSKFPLKSMLITRLSALTLDKTFIIGEIRGELYATSARRQDGKEDMDKLLKGLTKGFSNCDAGGHFKAAGGFFPVKYREEFKKRVINLDKLP